MTLLVTMNATKKAPIIMEGNSMKVAAVMPTKTASGHASSRDTFHNFELRIVAPDYKGANRVLAAIVIEGHLAVIEKYGELGPLSECVVDRPAEPALRHDLRRNTIEPSMEAIDDGCRSLGAYPHPLLSGDRMVAIP